ncbi:hypothetical protein ES332_A09G112400v1 [Gossypium tomentosum]|uniref:Uncharacterized protein n=1 Tax=Gossypium tomentosum TaxID=34277 RepID=A0A5D2P193_GOSTO|nr:hypothetical protein ES332_A09G112400v1 [Gossypium tomentosum]
MAFCHFSQLQAKYPIIRFSAPQLSSPRADSWVSPAHNVPPHRRDPKPPFLVPFPCPRDPNDGIEDVIRYGCALVCVRGHGVAAETLGRTEA